MLHVPLIIKLPKQHGARPWLARRLGVVRHMDIAPTLLGVLQLPSLPGQRGVVAREHRSIALERDAQARSAAHSSRCATAQARLRSAYGRFGCAISWPTRASERPLLRRRAAAWVGSESCAISARTAGSETRSEADEETHKRLESLGY
jgi:hypothetical protein